MGPMTRAVFCFPLAPGFAGSSAACLIPRRLFTAFRFGNRGLRRQNPRCRRRKSAGWPRSTRIGHQVFVGLDEALHSFGGFRLELLLGCFTTTNFSTRPRPSDSRAYSACSTAVTDRRSFHSSSTGSSALVPAAASLGFQGLRSAGGAAGEQGSGLCGIRPRQQRP